MQDPLYTEALEDKRFGNAASDYDIRHIGEYCSLLNFGDNGKIWKSVSGSPPDWRAP